MAGAGNLGAASTNTGPGLSGNMGSVMGEGSGGAMNFQYRRGGIASLVR